MKALEDLGLADDTLFVLLADHGESMTEHQIFFDHYGLYDCVLRVPLLMRWPGRIPGGTRVPGMFQISDIAPTLLDAAGIPVPTEMDGESFWPLLTGEQKTGGRDEIVSVESTWQAKWSLRTEDAKFILSREADLLGNPLRELYDLPLGPGRAAEHRRRGPAPGGRARGQARNLDRRSAPRTR